MSTEPIALLATVGPAMRSHRYWLARRDRGPRSIGHIRDWDLIQLDGRVHLHRQGTGAFDPRASGTGEATVAAAVEALVRKQATFPDLPLFNAFDHAICFRGDAFVALPAAAGGKPIRASSLARLLEMLQTERDRRLRIVVHVGLAKTGTTYLQRHVFPAIEGIHFVPMASYFLGTALRDAIRVDPMRHVDEIRAEFQFYLSTFDEPLVLISDEALTTFWIHENSLEMTASFLQKVFPTAEIVVTLREQVAILRSLYLQSFRGGWNRTMKSVADRKERRRTPEAIEADPLPGLDIGHFEYTNLLALYESRFRRVCVWLFEEFAADPDGFARRLADQLGGRLKQRLPSVRENPALGRVGVLLLTAVNALAGGQRRRALANRIDRLDRWLHWRFDPLAPELQAALRRRFTASNRVLQRKYGIDVARHWGGTAEEHRAPARTESATSIPVSGEGRGR